MTLELLFIALIGMCVGFLIVACYYYDKWVEAEKKNQKLRRTRNPMTP